MSREDISPADVSDATEQGDGRAGTPPDPVSHHQHAIEALKRGEYEGLTADLRSRLIEKLRQSLNDIAR